MSNHEPALQLVQETSRVLGKVLRTLPICDLEAELEKALTLVRRLIEDVPEIKNRSLSQIWWEMGVPTEETRNVT